MTKRGHHANQPPQAGDGQEGRLRGSGGSGGDRPPRRDELGRARRDLNDEVRLAPFEAALEDGKRLATEGMVRGGDADLLEVSRIQPRSMLAVVTSATSAGALC